ncbi:MAG: DNA primase [Vicinamibacterales bacterium]|jgi:DNA primase|nr:DNA primase [Acidobacteriota bacterium]MDP6372444.1 DNA primase [Vicinamibacterales bacterium]MDP6608933.1 DNA primase [Vicinamibacterales bacterium]HAK54285.1 DNA primase [Acidobacteriota bacterium]|tara:strand:+ start:311 stop:2074 length:1764 start_codon:yes stop_codon:yes gene_type:complete
MGLFPQSFIDDLKAQVDIVVVVQDHVPLKKAGTSFKGLCPFHSEKTPSFHVHRDRGFFHCFGCGVGGDVFKFLELQEKVGFQDAVRQLAQRFGVAVPELEGGPRDPAADAERESLLKAHEEAGTYFQEQLAAQAGTRMRQQLYDRGITDATIAQLGLGYAPPAREGLTKHLRQLGFAMPLLLTSGLVVERDTGRIDRFRSRLMIPICRESGSIVAFGGRAADAGQQPKYVNSPETPIYTKGRTLYGLHLTKSAIRKLGYAVLVEGYFDFAQPLQAGIMSVVATCGTALTPQQSKLLRRFTDKVVLSFDADPAGQTAVLRSGEMLVTEGFQVNVAVLPEGEDPDTFVQTHGGPAYVEKLRTSRPYLEFLLDHGVATHDVGRDEGRRAFLNQMLGIAARIPDAAARDQFADRLAHRARVMEEVVRTEIRKAAVERRPTLGDRDLPGQGQLRAAEKGLIWALLREPAAALPVLADLDDADLEDLASASILDAARALLDWPPDGVPNTLLERLNEGEASLASTIADEAAPPAAANECGIALKRRRFERERAAVQEEIDRLQQRGGEGDLAEIDTLWQRKKDLLLQLEALNQ